MPDLIGADDWDSLARNLLRAELMGRGMSYAHLVQALAAIGVDETEASIKNKVSRGRFPLTFFLQAMVAYPEVQKKAQAEIDSVVGEDHSPNWQDYANLPYIAQCVKESMRWRPVTPLA